MSETFAICPCKHCANNIEFDSSEFSEGETRIIECPHCHLETTLFIPKKLIPPHKSGPPTLTAILPINYPSKRKLGTIKKQGVIMLRIASTIMFIIGTGMSLLGCINNDLEQSKEQNSAIRQTVCVLQYGIGFILMALSMILTALIRLIQNKQGNSN